MLTIANYWRCTHNRVSNFRGEHQCIHSMENNRINQRISSEFIPSDAKKVRSLLSTYRHGSSEKVFDTILNIANGNALEIGSLIAQANQDPRDILSANRTPKEQYQAKVAVALVAGIFVIYHVIKWATT